jgi:hypothetical protein
MEFQIQQEPANYDISTPIEQDVSSSISYDIGDITGKAASKVTFSQIVIAIVVILFFSILFNLAYSFLYEICFGGINSRRKKVEVMGLATFSMTLLAFAIIFLVTRRVLAKRKNCSMNKTK